MKDFNDRITKIMQECVDSGSECGLQFAVYKDGSCVADAVAGYIDESRAKKVASSTMFPIFSTSKGIAATVIHRLADRGLLDYDAPIAHYWKEFGCNGKEGITLRHVMTHTSGLHNLPNRLTLEDISDWDRICGIIAKEAPQSVPGRHMEYHAVSYSWLVGEPACRVTGKDFITLMKEEISDVIGDPDIYIGMRSAEGKDIATLYEQYWDKNMITANEYASIPNCFVPLHEKMNMDSARCACMPASTGIASAKAVAKHYGALTRSGADGVKFLSDAQLDLALESVQIKEENSEVKALGYAIYNNNPTFGHGGYGGSEGFADLKNNLSIGFNKNLFCGGNTLELLLKEVTTEFAL